jgi:hypothetical protein
LNPIYITEFSVNKDKFTFTVPEVVETILYGLDGGLKLVKNIEGIDTLDEGHSRGVLFDDVFRMYLVENWHVTLVILVDKCHIFSCSDEIITHPEFKEYRKDFPLVTQSTYDCMMSKRGLNIWRV